MQESPPFYKRPWVWVVFGIVVILLPFGIHLSQQVGDRDWWKREATAYNRRHAVPDGENAAIDVLSQWGNTLDLDALLREPVSGFLADGSDVVLRYCLTTTSFDVILRHA